MKPKQVFSQFGNQSSRIKFFSIWLAAFCSAWLNVPANSDAVELKKTTDVAQVFRTFCSGCHNDQQAEADFSVGSYQSIMSYQIEGRPLVIKGDPDGSPLLKLIAGTTNPKMPPSEEPQPTVAEIELIRNWIADGARESGGQSLGWIAESDSVPVTASFQVAPAPLQSQFVSAATQLGEGRLALGKHSQVVIYDLDSNRTEHSIDLELGRITALRMSPSGRQLVVGAGKTGVSGQLILVDAATASVQHSFQLHSDSVYAVAMSPDETYLASGSYDRTIVVWDMAEREEKLRLTGHNGAITDLDFHPSGELLASTSTDGTVKLWHIPTGNRLDTLGQPEGEMRSVRFSLDGSYLLASGADRQIRCWQVSSTNTVAINPMLESRYAHEKDVLRIAMIDSETLVSSSADGTTKAWTIPDLMPLGTLCEGSEFPIGICHLGSRDLHVVDLKGNIKSIAPEVLKAMKASRDSAKESVPQKNISARSQTTRDVMPLPLDADVFHDSASVKLLESEPNNSLEQAMTVPLPSRVEGAIAASPSSRQQSDVDYFRFRAKQGEAWILEIVAARNKSPLDSFLDIFDSSGQPVINLRLQALRESYFTFRGKDSFTSDDFRLHKWEDMELDEYLYANSEVTRLWLYPRGPDSGFKVYPGNGARHTFFGTTPVTHALGDPAYIVRPLQTGETPLPNGLPVFPVYFENDDDPSREHGRDSVIQFNAPSDGDYFVRLRDARSMSGDDFVYEFIARRPQPDYQVTVSTTQLSVPRGSGREWSVSVKRIDGMNEAIEIALEGLPAGVLATNPVIIEAGQFTAMGAIHVSKDAELTDTPIQIGLTARVPRSDVSMEQDPQHGKDGPIARWTKSLPEPIQLSVIDLSEPTLHLTMSHGHQEEISELTIRPGQTVSAQLNIERNGLEGHVSCGRDDAGRNLPHGAFVDNIGLNGLLITEGNSSREIFITAAPKLKPGRYQFHFRTETAGNPTSRPIWLKVMQ